MDIFEYLKSNGGVARAAHLFDAGYSRRDIRRLAERGAAQPRRGVYAVQGCDEILAAAIQHNGFGDVGYPAARRSP
jgi:hypothetical protein